MGYTRARPAGTWRDWPDTSTPASAAMYEQWDQAIYGLERRAVNPLDYGAVGNGSASDVTALAAAVTDCPVGGTLYLPPGSTFALGSTWTVNKAVIVEAYGVTFVPRPGANGRIQIGSAAAPVTGLKWYGGSYDGTGGGAFCWGLNTFLNRGLVCDFDVSNTSADAFDISGDARRTEDGASTAGSQTITSATIAFTSADIGKLLVLFGAGSDGFAFETRITAVTDSATVTVALPAWKTVSSARLFVGTYQNTVFERITANAVALDALVAQSTSCGVTVRKARFQNIGTNGGTAGGLLSDGSPYFRVEDSDLDGINGYGIRLCGLKNVARDCHVRNWPFLANASSNDGIRLCEEGCEAVDCHVTDSKGASGSGYGMRLVNDFRPGNAWGTNPVGMKVRGGSVRGSNGIKVEFIAGAGTAPDNCHIDTTVDGSATDGLLVTAGGHHRIAGSYRNGGRDGIHATNVSDVTVDVICSGNAGWGVNTSGTSDRWRVAGIARAAENTAGATTLTGAANNTAALIV